MLLSACVQVAAQPAGFPTYDPFLPVPSRTPGPSPLPSFTPSATVPPPAATRQPTPTRVPLSFSLPPAIVGSLSPQIGGALAINSPTPDAARVLPTPRQQAEQYVVQPGDTLGQIAQDYGVSAQLIMEANDISDPNLLAAGMTLNIPAPTLTETSADFKILPDSEVVFGPATAYFNVKQFVESQNGYLKNYSEDFGGFSLAGYEIVEMVARDYSINPRLLLALLEYQSGWVTNPKPFNAAYPMGLLDERRYGLYRQLVFAANTLNEGYYLWRANALSSFALNDGTIVAANPNINAGTAAAQYFFSKFDDLPTWQKDVGMDGLILTYYVFFGNPFNYAVEPLVFAAAQPPLRLPFASGETWYYTGGPHGGWDAGSAWAALDFAPPGENAGCLVSPYWVLAVADGLILRSSNGATLQDLDNDGYEQTGWVILYMHIAAQDRVAAGEYVYAGERIGHPSCEGGVSNATHLHIARKFNGEWIPAGGSIPFNLDGWIASSGGREYDGYLSRDGITLEAYDSANERNQIYR